MFREAWLVDGHAHLEELEDLPQSLQEARASGVNAIIAVGSDKASNTRILEIAEENPNYVYPALGYHPWGIKEGEVEENLSFIQNHIKSCIALGEVGLDYRVKVKKELQWKVFDAILDFANKYDKPVIIHCRFSHSRTLKMVVEKGVRRAVFHWYSGPLDLLGQLLSLGYYISATPALQYSPPHQAAIKKAPLERILLETDTPVVYQGKESRPKDVRITLAEVSRIKGAEPHIVARQTTLNASQFFQILFTWSPAQC
jgi:TatD DNase family protein